MIFMREPQPDPITIKLGDAGEDIELQAIAHITSIMNALDGSARGRVLDYVCDRFPKIVTAELKAREP